MNTMYINVSFDDPVMAEEFKDALMLMHIIPINRFMDGDCIVQFRAAAITFDLFDTYATVFHDGDYDEVKIPHKNAQYISVVADNKYH